MYFKVCPAIVAGLLFFGGVELRAQLVENYTTQALSRHRQLDAAMKTSLGMKSETSDFASSESAAVAIAPQLRYGLTNDSFAQLEAQLKLATGRTQDVVQSDNPNVITLREASFNQSLTPDLQIGLGALSQADLNLPLLIDPDLAFLGFRQRWNWQSGSLSGRVLLMQSVPSSKSLSSENVENEKTPYLFSESLSFKWTDSETFAQTQLTHFRFQDLPRAVAGQSAAWGNSVDSLNQQYGDFRYHFEGLAARLELGRDLDAHRLSAGVQYLINQQAPQNQNQGEILFVDWLYRVSADWQIGPRLERIVNQQDSSPAYYSSPTYKHNNLAGWRSQLQMIFPKYDLRLEASYLKTSPINTGPLYSSQEVVGLALETSYANF